MSLFIVNTQKERKPREGEVRWYQRWDFVDSIFTYQTEQFPVSTWPNSRSHHLTPPLWIYLPLSPPQAIFLAVSFKRCKLLKDLIYLPSPDVVCLYFPHLLSQGSTSSLRLPALHPLMSFHFFLTLLYLCLHTLIWMIWHIESAMCKHPSVRPDSQAFTLAVHFKLGS